MEEYLMTYREVIPDQTNPEKWNDITLITGKKIFEVKLKFFLI